MATTNRDRVGKALDLLQTGLAPFVEREMQAAHGKYWITKATEGWRNEITWGENDEPLLDVAALLKILWDQWNDVFRRTLGHAERTLVSELREVRNKWAHQNPFSTDDTYRTLDSAQRLLSAVAAVDEASALDHRKQEVLRLELNRIPLWRGRT
ncbi:MAG: hypothetical protein H7Y32_03820 [Chloroflexales bacterium]|nr:hypothetical protein [Chloroflexales bacterium]